MSDFWDQDLSAHAFSTLAGQNVRMHAVKEGYELTTDGPIEGHPQLLSAALVLNRQLQPVRVTLHVRAGSNVHELRFVQASYERRPRASVPDSTFDPASYAAVHEFHSLGSSTICPLQRSVLCWRNCKSRYSISSTSWVLTPQSPLRSREPTTDPFRCLARSPTTR